MSKRAIEDTIVTFGVHRGWDIKMVKQRVAPELAQRIDDALSKEARPNFDVDAIMKKFEEEFGFLGNFWEKWADGSLPDQGGIMNDVKAFLRKELS